MICQWGAAQLFAEAIRSPFFWSTKYVKSFSACSGNRSAIFTRERSFHYASAEYYLQVTYELSANEKQGKNQSNENNDCHYALPRPRPHVSGYFLIRNFFFPDTKISASTRYVITYRIRPSTRIRIHSRFTEDWQNCPTRHWFVQV